MALRRSKRTTSQQHAGSVAASTAAVSKGPTQASRFGGYDLRRNRPTLRRDDAEAPRIQPMRAVKHQQMYKLSASHRSCEPHKPREQQHKPHELHELHESRELHTSRESRALRSTRECQARPVSNAQKRRDMHLQRLKQLVSLQIDRAERIVASSEALDKHASIAKTKCANMATKTAQHPARNNPNLEQCYDRRTSRTSEQPLLLAQSDEKVKIDGIGYERSSTGPFPRELVSKGEVIQGDKNDYVMYRVLATVSRDRST